MLISMSSLRYLCIARNRCKLRYLDQTTAKSAFLEQVGYGRKDYYECLFELLKHSIFSQLQPSNLAKAMIFMAQNGDSTANGFRHISCSH